MEDIVDSLRAELMRQKIIFESELRRQREVYEDRLERAEQALADRETDCRNLQSVITILGKKLDTVSEAVSQLSLQRALTSGTATPRRLASPSRSEAALPSPHRRHTSPLSHAISRKEGVPSLTLFPSGRAPSLNGVPTSISRTSSPGRASTVSSAAARPRVSTSVKSTTPRAAK